MDAEAFLATLRKDVLDPAEYADVSGVNEEIAGLLPVIKKLEARSRDPKPEDFFDSAGGRVIAGLLLGLKPAELQTESSRAAVDPFLRSWPSWLQGVPLKGAIVGLLLAKAHSTRKDRRRQKFEGIVLSALRKAVEERKDFKLLITSRHYIDRVRTFDLVIARDTQPIAAVIEVFQLGSGGRQGDVLRELPRLQADLDKAGISLIVIADGPGFLGMGSLVRSTLPHIPLLTNLAGVEKGVLSDFLRSALSVKKPSAPKTPRDRDAEFTRVAMEALSRGTPITPALLNTTSDTAEAFLLRFRASNPQYAIDQQGDTWTAASAESIRSARAEFARARTQHTYDSTGFMRGLSETLGLLTENRTNTDLGVVYQVRGLDFPLRLPVPLPVVSASSAGAIRESSGVLALERLLGQAEVPGRVIVLIDPFSSDESRKSAGRISVTRRLQIAVLDEGDVVEILLRTRSAAREQFRQCLIRDADLTLVSPFVADGPTSSGMFFGREIEIKRIAEQIREHSFALVGGRKAGKTSLLQKLSIELAPDHKVVYIDCQAHPDREDFLRFIVSQTPATGDADTNTLSPHAEMVLRRYIEAKFGNTFGVILIDEVDDLFLADATAQSHPHVLSRALRALAQAHQISIVATGERALFSLTRDPSSPHWNFCTPIRIGPIDAEPARRLLMSPLQALSITVTNEAVDRALYKTVRHPNLLQHLGGSIIDFLAPSSLRGAPLSVDAAIVDQISQSPGFRDRFVRTYWSQATVLERLISADLSANEPRNPDVLWTRLSLSETSASISDVHDALAFLELYTIAKATEGGYVFASPTFEEYMSVIPQSLRAQWKTELMPAAV
jgi:hypothetical protein